MRLFAKIAVAVIANAVALYLAATFIHGFVLAGGPEQVLWIALVLTALNFFLKPIFTLVLGPVIILTLGLGLIIVNALILSLLDFLSGNLTIETIPALLYATLLIGVINFVFHMATK